MKFPDHFEADMAQHLAFAEENAGNYASASPFAHTMIDDFVKPDVLETVWQELSDSGDKKWGHMNDSDQNKFATANTAQMGPATRALIQFLNGQEMMGFLEALTGIEGLIPDPQLAGGGLHELRSGGFLRVHADFNFQPHLRLDRRINLLLYLNKDWDESYGGNLELWDEDMTACQKRYAPNFNRCVIFNTTDRSFHGNPEPVAAPDGRTRRSIAMYYYTNGRPADEVSSDHMTLFHKRPGELSASDKSKLVAKRWLPPAVYDMLQGLKSGAK